MNAVIEYFSGEKFQCMIGIGISSFSIGLALYFIFQLKTSFSQGMAWPFLIVSALLLTVCIGIVLRTPTDIERVSVYIEQTPEKISSEELVRMEAVMRTFKIIKNVEIILTAIGVCLLLFGQFKGSSYLSGIGLGLAIQSFLMYGFDHFAQIRGEKYLEFLENYH